VALGEFELIEQYFRGLSDREGVLVGIGDDCAVVDWPAPLAISTDTLIQGVHFPARLDPVAVGHRCLAANLSDVAAMGAVPRGFTLALTLPAVDGPWLAGFAQGLGDLARRFNVALIGGDTTRGELAVTITVIGEAGEDSLLRGGANVGDGIFVSGALGGALAGLEVINMPQPSLLQSAWVSRFCYPQPRLELGQTLVGLASAAIDLSDGLLADLGHLIRASGCGASLSLEQLPVVAGLAKCYGDADALQRAVCGGDEYELCFTVPPDRVDELPALATRLDLPLTQIGMITTGERVRVSWRGADWQPEQAEGYEHFR
jgi:thiamine-monophosphate kinase